MNKGVETTNEGKIFIRYAQKVIEQAELLEETYTTEPFRAKTGDNEYNFFIKKSRFFPKIIYSMIKICYYPH